MTTGEQIVYGAARAAAALYFAALIAPPQSPWRRRLWTAGWLVYLGHVAAAFHFVHHWSHADAAIGTGELRRLIPELVDALGGELEIAA